MLKLAKENDKDSSRAAVNLQNLIHSFKTPRKAVQSIEELERFLATGTFKIKEWLTLF